MAHSNIQIEAALRSAIKDTVDADKDELLTVRYIRDLVGESLKLDEGFFVTGDWKGKSKHIIKDYAAELLNAKEEAKDRAKATTIEVILKPAKQEVKKVTKRAAQTDKSRPTKRRKKEAISSSDLSDEVDEDELEEEQSEPSNEEKSAGSDFNDSDISDAPQPKKNTKSTTQAPASRQTKKKAWDYSVESADDDIGDAVRDADNRVAASTSPKKSRAAKEATNKRKSKKTVIDSDEESEDEKVTKKSISPEKAKPQSPPRRKQPKLAVADDEDDEVDTKENTETKANDSDSEMSVVLDEAPKPKKRSRKPKSDSTSVTKSSKPTREKPAPKEPSPIEQQIKTLQSQLVKCGVRKIWQFELKEHGDNGKAKIRHLQEMLKEIGMTGRFSEQRAKEIKELRELQADLDAVKEGEKSWGLDASGRRNRGQRRSLKESSIDESDDEGAGGNGVDRGTRSRSVSEKPVKKVARAKQELAFLGDEDESDSD